MSGRIGYFGRQKLTLAESLYADKLKRQKKMKQVSLDPYRTEGVKVFSGEPRGKIVAEEIKRVHGEDVEITIPNDVYVVTNSFRRGFNLVLPNSFNMIK